MTVNQCLCQTFSFGAYGPDGSAESYTDYNTGCTQTTARVFAQGHDAKLVGFMVRAELAGEEIRQGSITYTGGAVRAARTVSEALAAKAQAQLDAAKARLAKKAEVAARKAANRSAKKAVAVEAPAPTIRPTNRTVKIKVGRWTYDASVATATGQATYTTKLGAKKTVELGEYTEM